MSGRRSVFVGLSGGVDSAVTAAKLLQEGYEVFGHFLDIGLGGQKDAQKVAAFLGIPFSVGDIKREIEEHVCVPFQEEHLAGRTPLPCARCNPTVKFPALFQAAKEQGAELVATGHYARIRRSDKEDYFLCRGEAVNDQSYMLARLPKAFLPKILFPLGDYKKTEVRDLARDFHLPVADKPDSMEICFIPDGDYAAWLEQRGETPPKGSFVDRKGDVLGEHQGIHHYTVGQRRGLGIASGERLFVSEIRPETNEVVLSGDEALYATQVFCEDLNLLADMTDGMEIGVRLRHSKTEYPATIHFQGKQSAELKLLSEARAPTPGQLAVFYDGDIVLGSGWIAKGV